MDPYRLTVTQALSNIKNGSLTIEQYARSLLSRVQERDSTVQAWTHLEPDHVIEEARRLDRVPFGERGPVHGLPVAVKDLIYTKDMPTQYGSPIYDGHAPELDAASIIVLRQAGALILGKTTTTEFASTQGGPKTCNPHDPTRTPGGSSSGSAAAVGDFQAPVGIGSQTGGSVIRPGSFNGVYAFKPTWNAISREGLKFYSPILDTIGFFARCVDDLELVTDLFDIEDDEAVISEFTVRGAKFGVAKTVVWPKAGPGTKMALESAAQLLRSHGAEVEEVELSSEFDRMPEWHNVLTENEARATFLPEYRLAKEKLSPFLTGRIENVNKVSRAAQLEAYDGIAALRPKIDEIAKGYAAILTPSVVDEAPLGLQSTGSPVFNSMWTALHTPVINIPGFKGANDMPIGISLVAPRYHDRRLLVVSKAVGAIFEAEGGWERKL
ncbi:amidase [Xylaria bambusicola]|uniref:amidase n=1 Tax=Xylaria bambusicola TaxID=326684 RepID=UPI0020086650|nr:amidase [Xylaria bambusicola]KAI0509103.1 amidase [Xylaria bambusicola]